MSCKLDLKWLNRSVCESGEKKVKVKREDKEKFRKTILKTVQTNNKNLQDCSKRKYTCTLRQDVNTHNGDFTTL